MTELHLHEMWTTQSPLTQTLLEQFKQSSYSPKLRFSKTVFKKALTCILANLFQAKKYNCKLIYSRQGNNQKVNAPIIDFLTSIGYVTNYVQKQSSHNTKSSTCELTSETYEAKREEVIVMLANDVPFIKLRSGGKNKKTLPLPNKPNLIKKLNSTIKAYNEMWLENDVCDAGGDLVIPFGNRSFTDDLTKGGRFYWHGQTATKAERKGFLINGEPTLELDYKAIHFNLLYNDVGQELKGDPYFTDGYDRKVIKLAMISFMNISTRKAFVQKVTLSGKMENSKCDGFIDGMPAGINGKDLADSICNRHSAIQHLFHGKDIGIKLQRRDSEVMDYCLAKLINMNIPCLPYHDGIRFPQSKNDEVYAIMREAYLVVTGFNIQVDAA